MLFEAARLAAGSADIQAWPELAAPPSWRMIDFISDLHLHAAAPDNFLAWQDYMDRATAQAVFILGDLFDVWVGDDLVHGVACLPSATDSFEDRCAQTLLRASKRLDVFFMCGNRDFLVGEAFTRACGVRLLHDPSILSFAGQRWLLSHGDALCLADTSYMQFRALVRSPAWQQEFLGKPLQQRKAIAHDLRLRSEARKRTLTVLIDVDTRAATQWLLAATATCLIHGHTHRPANHDLGGNLRRVVLSDWDLQACPARAQVLRISIGANDGPANMQRIAMGSD